MKSKAAILTLLLSVGFTFQQCFPCRCPDVEGAFFDIQGMNIIQYKNQGGNRIAALAANEVVGPDNYHGFRIDYLVDYISQAIKGNQNWNLSLLPSAMACSCIVNGELGSKEEKIELLEVVSLKDFDDNHLANSTINDLLEVSIFGNIKDLNTFIQQDSTPIRFEDLGLQLRSLPTLNDTFQVKVRLVLNTGEEYEEESVPIIFTR